MFIYISLESTVAARALSVVKMARNAHPVTHCLFVDDYVFFVKAFINECET